MNIAIDARMYGKGAGIARYVETMVHGLERHRSEFSFSLYLKPDMIDDYRARGGTLQVVEAPYHWYGWEEQTKFLSLLNRGSHDLVHFPHWNVPIGYRRPYVVTIHDLRPITHPEWEVTRLSPPVFWFKDRMRRLIIRHAAQNAAQVIVPSEFTKAEVCEVLRVPSERVSVVHLFPDVHAQEKKSWELVREKFELNQPYILYVGAAYPHKNLYRLVTAWGMVAESDMTHELILVGEKTEFYQELEEYVKHHTIPRARIIGLVDDQDLRTIYTHARVLVFPSLYEGFGLPPLEAMSEGVPVLASTAGSIPEVVGDAGYYVDPTNTKQIADGIATVLGNRACALDLIRAGAAQVRLFSPSSFFTRTYEVYRKALK